MGQDHRVSECPSDFRYTTAAGDQAAADFNCLAPKVSYSEQETPITPRRKAKASSKRRCRTSRRHTGDIGSDDVDFARAPGCDQGKLQQLLKGSERSLQQSVLKSWKIRKLPCEQEFKLPHNRRKRKGTQK